MIEREDVEGVAIVRLAHGKVNALDLELVTAITATFTELASAPHRAVILCGAGRALSAGVDLHRVVDGGPAYIRRFLPALVESFEAVFNLGKPVVAAVNGHAIAGGCILVSACDHRTMAAGRIGVTELLVGVPFPVAALEILTYAVGAQRARSAVLTGATYDPPEAAEMGMVDDVVAGEDLLASAVASANAMADAVPADTFGQTKRQLRRESNERIQRRSLEEDDVIARLWEARVADGWISAFMTRVTARG